MNYTWIFQNISIYYVFIFLKKNIIANTEETLPISVFQNKFLFALLLNVFEVAVKLMALGRMTCAIINFGRIHCEIQFNVWECFLKMLSVIVLFGYF